MYIKCIIKRCCSLSPYSFCSVVQCARSSSLGTVKWFPPLCKLEHFFPLIIKILSNQLPPASRLQVHHTANHFLRKERMDHNEKSHSFKKKKNAVLANLIRSQASRETQYVQRDLGLPQGPPTAGTRPKHLTREVSGRHPN